MRSLEELAENQELCDTYCPLPEEVRGIHVTPSGYTACEGCKCDEAYKAYQEECTEQCVNCGAKVHPDEAEYIQVSVDCEYGPYCGKCLDKLKEDVVNE